MEVLDLQPIPQADQIKENLLPDTKPSRIFKESVKITSEGKLKALFLKAKDSPITDGHYKPALNALRKMQFRSASISDRPMVKQNRIGGDLLLGWLLRRSSDEDYFRANNRKYLFQSILLAPLVADMEAAMAAELPDYYKFHVFQASKLLRPPDEKLQTLHLVKDPFQKAMLEILDNTDYYHFPGGRAFSTLTLNRNILFGAHDDGNNMPGTLSCLTALGNFVGGYLCFPRLGIGFDVQPRDVLISDTNYEYHCSSNAVFGERYSIVAYLHKSMDKGWRAVRNRRGELLGVQQYRSLIGSVDDWELAKRGEAPLDVQLRPKLKLPFDYTPNFLTKEEANELVSYFETLKFDVRPNPRNPENPKYNIKRQSLGYIASNAFNDRDEKKWGTKYADIETMPEILQRFRRKLAQHAGQEINYISILKYPNSDATINWHNHREDHWHNSPVWDVTIGPTERRFWAREVANPKNTMTSVLAETGSLVTLPASMNTTHEHAILKDKTTGIRYSINCKSLPLYAVWECRAGKNYPRDAVYVGCRVRDRKGKVIREGTIFGNGTNPLASHKGALKTEAEFREYAERRMQDPEFRAKVRGLKGKHLLCWCVQSGPKRAKFCHARVWLEIANKD